MNIDRNRFKFFLEHAGYSSPPGRAACALSLARAEQRLENDARVTVTSETDWDTDVSFDDSGVTQRRVESGAWVAEWFALRVDGEVMGSLGGCIYEPGDGYDRVVAAELADEYYSNLDEWQLAHVRAAYGV